MTHAETVAVEATFLYRAYGMVLKSDLLLPMLPAVSRGAPSLRVRRILDTAGWVGSDLVHEVIDEDGALFSRVERAGERYVWHYPSIGRFGVARDGRIIEWSANEANRADAAAVVSGPVLGFALQLQGETCLHGSAVVVDGTAVGLLAPSGYGKSTLAAALLARGAALLTDDVLALVLSGEQPEVRPSYPAVKLWPDALERVLDGAEWEGLPRHASWLDKRVAPAVDLGAVWEDQCPLSALYVLVPVAPDCNVATRQLQGTDALVALLSNGYVAQLLTQERELLAQQLEVFRRVAETTPIYAVACPRDAARLGEVVDAIMGTAAE
jgi:hypothetical protein